jgi:hypothetical protein
MKCPYCIKVCTKCGEILVANNMNFAKNKKGKYGLDGRCKKCKNQHKKEYYKNNADKIKKYQKEYRKNNAEQIKEQKKEYYQNNLEKEFNRSNRRRQREKSQGMGITKEQWLDMMKYFDWKCAYSGKSLKDNNRTIDHVKPLIKGGLNEIFNCVPCDRSVNSSKHDKDFLQWYEKQEFYDESRLQRIYEWQQYCLETYYEYIKIS